jgi:hypothetical protein
MVPEAVSFGMGAVSKSASASDKRPLSLCRRFGTTDCSSPFGGFGPSACLDARRGKRAAGARRPG